MITSTLSLWATEQKRAHSVPTCPPNLRLSRKQGSPPPSRAETLSAEC